MPIEHLRVPMDPANLPKFLETAQRRNKLIPQLMDGRVFEAASIDRGILAEFLAYYHMRNIRPHGRDNLILGLKTARKLGLPITLHLHHESDADSPALLHALRVLGFEELASKVAIPAGIKMDERFYIRPWVKMASVLRVITPYDIRDIKDVVTNRNGLYNLDPHNLELALNYEKKANALNLQSMREMINIWQRGWVVGAYLHASRSRSGLVGENPSEMEVYCKRGIIIPILNTGMASVLPVEKPPRLFISRVPQYLLIVGQPYFATDLTNKNTRAILKEEGATIIDLATARIAQLADYTKVEPTWKEPYRLLNERMPNRGLVYAA
ncbi:hypothetical protein HYS91_03375 [Candidatus Daviesbacteria bacterium]|nr:hypothetical protein [Candidatus Daviesbacteria bacterium]